MKVGCGDNGLLPVGYCARRPRALTADHVSLGTCSTCAARHVTTTDNKGGTRLQEKILLCSTGRSAQFKTMDSKVRSFSPALFVLIEILGGIL